jgi:hypothetical protein
MDTDGATRGAPGGSGRKPLDEETCRRFGALVLLHRVISTPAAYHAALLEGDDSLLEPSFDFMLAEDLVTVGEDDHYRATAKGQAAYRNLLHQQQSYLAHYDIYGAVDLAEGVFADPERDWLDDARWSDLRVAVAEYKGIDPYRMVFLSMLADGSFFGNPNWKFDLALGSSFFKELEEIVRSQLTVGELGYGDEDGSRIAGEAVLEDVILQGARINRERMERERERQASLFEEDAARREREAGEDEEGEALAAWVPYDPWAPLAAYAGSALFVEALWLSGHW